MRDHADGIEHAQNAGQEVRIMPEKLTNQQEQELILIYTEQFGADVMVIDLPYHDVDTSYFTYLKKKGMWTIFIDDARYISPDADVILNSSILAVNKTRQVKNIRYLLGPDYFIYDEPQRSKHSWKRGETLNVVVTFGGSDPAGLTLRVLESLSKKQWTNVAFKVILGPGYTDHQLVKKCILKILNSIQIFSNPPDLYPFFLDCDLAICSGGRTLYELHALQVPTFAIASIEHEIPVIQGFLERNMVVAGLQSWNEQEFQRLLDRSLNMIYQGLC
jgi:spore coat polysaccharide biosynthesis predicted glycosyltransferase SpsG